MTPLIGERVHMPCGYSFPQVFHRVFHRVENAQGAGGPAVRTERTHQGTDRRTARGHHGARERTEETYRAKCKRPTWGILGGRQPNAGCPLSVKRLNPAGGREVRHGPNDPRRHRRSRAERARDRRGGGFRSGRTRTPDRKKRQSARSTCLGGVFAAPAESPDGHARSAQGRATRSEAETERGQRPAALGPPGRASDQRSPT